MTFTRVPQPLAEALEAHGYESLTAVQAAVVEAEAQGRDLVVSAQTGSGKTVAFGLAMADELLAGEGITRPGAPLALAIAPTRELALQVSRELTWLYARTGARIVTCVGGMDPVRERKQLEQGATIVVGTPGRLRDHLERGKLDLEQLRVAILDEADEMLDMGFREDLEEILDATAKDRRTLLFSATMPKPIEALARRYQKNSLRISTMSESRGHGDISYQAVTVAPADIERVVVNLLRLHEAETAILFCATRDNVRHLHATLTERGFSAVALSGEHSQNERNNALQALRDRRARVCVATDVAARGIDLPSLSLVIHVEIPRDAETLQHRSGRTGRAGKKGTAVIVVPFPRRRRVESMLRGARVQAEWIEAPTPEQIRRNDRERLIEQIMQPVEFDEEDREIAKELLGKTSAEDLAAALVRSFRERMPQPEELIGSSMDGQQKRQRPGFDDVVWFRMDIGKRQNADPRWILPLLCRRGHVTRNAVGAIRISANETYFQIPSEQSDQFAKSVARTAREGADDEAGVLIELAPDTPRDVAKGRRREEGGPRRHPRGEGGPPRGEGKRHQPRPTGHKGGAAGQFGKKQRKDRRGD
ncbi:MULTISPECIES: DEAD/DEAH box helicase [Novosphingobium]|uniref:ATP-dependent RNA helicase DeaD n=1 Tax=Novosphingobium pentaromativorans US6-1 TaxID=1088721 RepID=G6EIW5_9SPHN|nr:MULTISPECIES: DEAD/DEAH box helicase [Novosphingobium]AIT78926.1 DEAD/DEAH box helicase [Novosphingobium pentaromativorans US6-1]EHJ58724.1 ATP-dependent RNA helicase DeaD [Novosphingobium pentaromativorans US6-1]CCA93422.1 ATP-dependent RNA helicase DeaD [Novosphingobium sp. PP1Y]